MSFDFFAFPQGITEAKVEKVLEAIGKEKSFSFISGTQCLQFRQRIVSAADQALKTIIAAHAKEISRVFSACVLLALKHSLLSHSFFRLREDNDPASSQSYAVFLAV